MKRNVWAALACCSGMAGGLSNAAEPSLCSRLAEEARRLPVSAWDSSEPLRRWLQASRPPARRQSPTERVLANDAVWQGKVAAPSAEHIGVQHLQGTPVYLLDYIGGTAHCQQYVLAEVTEGRPPQELESPFGSTVGLCMGGWARPTQVMNRPALVMGEAPSAGFPRGEYRIAAWTDKGWSQPCRLKLSLRTQLKPTQRFCTPGSAICEAGQAVALRLAMASESDTGADADPFTHEPPDEVLAALNPPLSEAGAVGDPNLPLPTFDAKHQGRDGFLMQFSNSDPVRLPVFIDGRWWLAVVGRAGIGWRKGDAVNVALFAPPGRATDAVASYQFGFVQMGLLEATATDLPR